MLDVSLDTHLGKFHLALGFRAEEGKTTVLLGESGAGKSTVLRLLAGLLHAQKGHISFNGTSYYDSERHLVVPPQERPFGYVFQDYVLFPHLNVFENIAFGLRAQHLPRRLIGQRVEEVLAQVRLTGFETRRPHQISGGQQQRIAIARVLALRPRLLLLDEPLAALDVQTRREVRQELRRILSEINVTTILVTHQYLEALLFGEQILVLDHGTIIQQGGQQELREYPRSPYVAELIGVNFFQGRIAGYEQDRLCIIHLQDGLETGEVIAALKELKPVTQAAHTLQTRPDRPAIGQEVFVVVHPRSITLHQERPQSSARNVFRGEISHVLRLGTTVGEEDGHVRVSIMLAGMTAPLTAEVTEASAVRMTLSEGRTVYAAFKATEASVYI